MRRLFCCDACSKKIEMALDEEYFFCEDCKKEVFKYLEKKRKKKSNLCQDKTEQCQPYPLSTDL